MNITLFGKLLARVPTVAWLVFSAIVLALSALAIAYHRGQGDTARRVATALVQDSVRGATAAVAVATIRSDSTVAEARHAVAATAVNRVYARAQLAVITAAAPDSVQSAIAVVDAQLSHDSLTIEIQASAIDTLLQERADRIRLDTLVQHELTLSQSAGGDRSRPIAIALGVVAALLAVLHFIR